MKIALVHCYYQLRGGEDAVFEQEKSLLSKTDEVCTFTLTNSPGLKGLVSFLFSFHNLSIQSRFRTFLRRERPDIVHIHNWHYAMGPIVIRAAKKAGIPVVMTLHNYRLLCPSGTLLHNGKLFTDSIKASFPWSAVLHKVYRRSYFQTFWLAFVVKWNQLIGTWRMVDKYITLTHVSKQLFADSHLRIQADKFFVKPNFTETIPFSDSVSTPKERFLYVGRLSEEKGIRVMLEAFANTDLLLTIVGEGPLSEEVRHFCSAQPNVEYVGTMDKAAIRKKMFHAPALLFPSIWYEPFGLVLIEAFSVGCPIIASKIGSPLELVQEGINGLLFEPGDSARLKERLLYWRSLPDSTKEGFRANAQKTYNELYAPPKNKELLMGLYKSVLS